MATKKITIDNLDTTVKQILEQYADDIKGNLDDALKAVGQKGATALKNKSKELFHDPFDDNKHLRKGRYGQGWTVTMKSDRLHVYAVVHNKTYPSLVHLLEYGHLDRNGRRSAQPHPHVEPAQREIERVAENEVIRKINEIQ